MSPPHFILLSSSFFLFRFCDYCINTFKVSFTIINIMTLHSCPIVFLHLFFGKRLCGWVLQRDQGPVNVTASLRHTYLLGTSASSFFRLEETSFTTSVSKNYKYSDTRDTWTAFSLKHLILEIGRTDALPQIHFGHNL